MALTKTDVSGLYVAIFNRASEGEGNTYWQNTGMDMAETADAMLATSDAQEYFGSSLDDNQAFIEHIYANTLNKTIEDDPDGIAFWVQQLEDGVSRGQVVASLVEAVYTYADSTDPVTKAAYDQFVNRVEVSNYTADVVETAPEDYKTSTSFSEDGLNVTSDPASVDAAIESINQELATFNLTNDIDTATANIFNSVPAYTPEGNDFINTLQDEDHLTGVGIDPTLNVTLGSVNDAAETIIAPILDNIKIMNLDITGNTEGIDFLDVTGLEELNINRITATNSDVQMLDLDESTTKLSVNNATRDGSVTFNYAEGMLEGSEDSLALTLDNLSLSALNITQGTGNGDDAEDEGFGFETVNIDVTGTTNLDQLVVTANEEEQAEDATVTQTINIDAQKDLELNNLTANGAENINITATGDVVVTANERNNTEDNINTGLDLGDGAFNSAELTNMVITGDGKVTLNGVDGGDTGVTIDASAMTNTLAIRVGDTAATNADSSLVSGSGDDEVITATDTAMDITTNAGVDTVKIDGDMTADLSTGEGDVESDADTITVDGILGTAAAVDNNTVTTGAGADTLTVTGDINADVNTGSEDDTVTSASINGSVFATESGNDTVTVNGVIADDVTVGTVLTMADGDDSLKVTGTDAEVSGLSAASSVNTGAGDDTVTFGSFVNTVTLDAVAEDKVYTITVDGVEYSYTATATDTVATVATALADKIGENATATATGVTVTTDNNNAVTATNATNVESTIVVDTDGTITTEDGNDYVSVSGDVNGNVDLGTGADTLTVDGDLAATVTAGSDAETGNDDGQDSVTIDGNMTGTASITTQAGDDTVSVKELFTATADDVSRDGITTETEIGGTINAKGADKTEDYSNIDTTQAASIATGEGDDTVSASNLHSAAQYNDNVIANDNNRDDSITIVGASIETGAGDDVVNLTQAADTTDLMQEQTLVDTAEGNDTVTATINTGIAMMADNTQTGVLSDIEGTRDLTDAPAMPEDPADDTVPFNPEYTIQDTLGAKIDLGEGVDTLTFNDVNVAGTADESTLVVDDGAVITAGNEGDTAEAQDTLTVTTVDAVSVVSSKDYTTENVVDAETGDVVAVKTVLMGTNDATAADGQGGHIEGIEEINLTIENSISDVDAAAAILNPSVVANDDNTDDGDLSGAMQIDVEQVDAQLNTLNLTSNETRLFVGDSESITNPGAPSTAPSENDGNPVTIDYGYIAGETTTFVVDNFRDDANIDLNLAAYEVTGLGEALEDIDGDGITNGSVLADDCTIDVNLAVNMDAQTDIAENRNVSIDVNANTDIEQDFAANYDIALTSETLYKQDSAGNIVSTLSDAIDARFARDITLDINDAASHYVNLESTYGNEFASVLEVYKVYDIDGNYLDTVEATDATIAINSVNYGALVALDLYDAEGNLLASDVLATDEADAVATYNSADPAPTVLADSATSEDVETSLTVNTADTDTTETTLDAVHADTVTVTGATDTFLRVDQSNNYTITTGSGDDVISMKADVVDANDTIDGGAGNNTLVIGAQDINLNSTLNNITNIQNVVVEFQEGQGGLEDLPATETSNIEVNSALVDSVVITNSNEAETGINDKDALDPSLDTVNLTVASTTAGSSLNVNANIDNAADLVASYCPQPEDNVHSDELVLNIDSTGTTNLDVDVNVSEGTQINFINVGNADTTVNVNAEVSALDDTQVDSVNNGNDEGELQLDTDATSAIDRLTLFGAAATYSEQNVVIDGTPVDADEDGVIDTILAIDTENGTTTNTITVNIDNTWATTALEIDASAITDSADAANYDGTEVNDVDVNDAWVYDATVDNLFDGAGKYAPSTAEEDAQLTISGTQNRDFILGGWQDDTLMGNDGNDVIKGNLGKDTIDGGAGDDRISGQLDGDTLTGGEGADTFVLGDRANPTFAQAAIDESNAGNNGDSADTITDFTTGVDTLEINLGLIDADADGNDQGNDNFVDLSSYATVANPSDGDDSLSGTPADLVIGDAYYSTEAGVEKFVMDVDGNGDITTNDITIMSPGAINATDLDIELETGAGDDMIRLGQGVDRIEAGADDDTFVIVGSIDEAQRAIYAADKDDDGDLNAITDFGLDNVVDENQLLSTRTETEATAGDSIDGGSGNDVLHVYGAADLTQIVMTDIETLDVHSNVTLTVDQLNAFTTIIFDGSTEHTITIVDADGNLAINELTGEPLGLDAYTGYIVTNGSTITVTGVDTFDADTGYTDLSDNANIVDTTADLPQLTMDTIDDINDRVYNGMHGNLDITGTGMAGAEVSVVVNDGTADTTLQTTVLDDGTWSVTYAMPEDFEGEISVEASSYAGDTAVTATDAFILDNVLPVTEDVTGSVAEVLDSTDTTDENLAGTLTAVDGNTVTFAIDTETTPAEGEFGTLVVDSTTGEYTYTKNAAAIEALNDTTHDQDGEVATSGTDTFTIVTIDALGNQNTSTITFDITGANDLADVTGDITGTTNEDATDAITGNLASVDVDNTDDLFTAMTETGTYGDYEMNDQGEWTYALNTDLNYLAEGESVTDTFTATTVDGTEKEVTITIEGVNDAPVITQALVSDVDGTITFTASDVDTNDTLTVNWVDSSNETVTSGEEKTLTASAASVAQAIDLAVTDAAGAEASLETVVMVGTIGDDSFYPTIDSNKTGIYYGFDGDDSLVGGSELDYFYGGTGNDTMAADDTDIIDGGDDDDIAQFDAAVSTSNLTNDDMINVETVEITNADTDETYDFSVQTEDLKIVGNDANDTIYGGSGADIIEAGDGADIIYGGDGSDTKLSGQAGDDTIYGGNGDEVVIYGGTGNDTIYGEAGNDAIEGNEGSDLIYGGEGNDTLYGDNASGASADDGADTFYVESGTDTIMDLGRTDTDADTLIISAGATANATVVDDWTATSATKNEGGSASNANLSIAAGVSVDLSNATVATAATDGFNASYGNDGDAFTFVGSTGDDTFSISKIFDNQIINGNDGDDVLNIVNGDSTSSLDGVSNVELININNDDVGNGNHGSHYVLGVDTLVAAGETVTINHASTNGAVLNIDLSAETDGHFIITDNSTEDDSYDTLTVVGGQLSDTITGSAFNDTIDGGLGADTIDGGAGDDTLIIDDDDIIIDGGDDTDTVQIAAAVDVTQDSFTNVENIEATEDGADFTITVDQLAGITSVTGDGTNDDEQLVVYGNTSDNVIDVSAITFTDAGATLKGIAGTNQLIGGSATDTIIGGDDVDTIFWDYYVDNTLSDEIYDGGAGDDTLVISRVTDNNDAFVDDNDFANMSSIETLAVNGDQGDGTGRTITVGSNAEAAGITTVDLSSDVGNGGGYTVDASAYTTAITIIGSGDFDTLTGGAGADTIILGVNAGKDVDTIAAAGDTGTYTYDDVDGSSTVNDGDTISGSFDLVTDFLTYASNGNSEDNNADDIDISAVNDLSGGAETDLTLAANTYQIEVGTWDSATGVFTINASNGTDTFVAFDDGANDVGIVLTGVTDFDADHDFGQL